MSQYTENEINGAIADIKNGTSARVASRRWGVPRSTLQDRIRGAQQRAAALEDLQRLSNAQEVKLASWVQIQADLGLPPTHQQVREFAQRILRAMGDHKPLGKRWMDGFLRRNPSIKVQRSRSIDSRRINGASTEVIREWFKYLVMPHIAAIKPANRYNMDETGILEGKGDNGLVLGRAETKSVRKKQPGSRAWVSIIECISAEGKALHPLVIYKGKTVQQQWFPLDLGPYDGWEFTATENGWTTDDTAVEWLTRVFLPQSQPCQPDQARLLIVDGHRSHTTTDFMWLCYTYNVHLLFLPPHTSYVLQPLDQLVFSPVKSAYRKELGYLSLWNDSTIIGKRNSISCYQKARQAGLTESNIKSGWKYTGLWPVAIAKPLMSSHLLPDKTTPLTPLNKAKKGGQDAQDIEGWASVISSGQWSTPRKRRELDDQLRLFTQLDQTIATQRQLFRMVKKGFQEQAFKLAAAEHQIQLLQARVDNSVARKRKAVQLDLNTKFATIKEVRQAQIKAGDAESELDESSASELSSEAESCIIVASRGC
ncbi:putative transposase [Colletotrichum sublineola]|uniref:Putative transposase n=1 Tax=Colletotrichum sublineola TaxID=1173701 RepID=A0A066XSE3_COLSU|nr:putative transposase [Colletotrichum sublineola]